MEETVLRRILKYHYTHETGSIHAQAFANGKDQSGQWTDRHSVSRERYTSAPRLKALAPNPDMFGVAAIAVRDYEAMSQEIYPTPTPSDRGHCDAVGKKTARVKEYLRKKAVMREEPPP